MEQSQNIFVAGQSFLCPESIDDQFQRYISIIKRSLLPKANIDWNTRNVIYYYQVVEQKGRQLGAVGAGHGVSVMLRSRAKEKKRNFISTEP